MSQTTNVLDKKTRLFSKSDELKLVLDVLLFENKISKNTFDRLAGFVTAVRESFPTGDDFFSDLVSAMDKRTEPSRSSTKFLDVLVKVVTYKGNNCELKLTNINQ